MKPIVFSISPVPNYLTFILCTCGINWRNEFSDQYSDFLNPKDKSFLINHATELSFGDGAGDPLMELFYFLPAHVCFEKDNRIIEYFQVLGYGASQGDFKQLFMRFHSDLEHIREYYPTFLNSFQETLAPERYSLIHDLAGIYQKYYPIFLNTIWSQAWEDFEYNRAWIETLYKGKTIIGDWEILTGLTFRNESYKLGLIPYLKYGPQANSLSYDKNLFYGNTDENTLNYYRYFISHEVGTHLLKEYTLDRFSSEDENMWTIAYIAMENIARFYNMKIIPISLKYPLGEMYYHESIFEKILTEIESEFPGDITKQYMESITRYQEDYLRLKIED
ncbi:MAG TPA: hypothetical protein PLE74_10985 [Candidatus Cloacimonadota bacterium]|mgnify:CR=1 FL=1|nr:hypothetical protein [Candidatus Cloacimonadota bacterium]HPT72793.1 hypothetical protein [Candidatus Cloacimonadota bacterium]